MTTLQPRDNEILSALTLKVRLFSLDQMADAWWTATRSGRDNARKRMSALVRLGLLVRVHPLARPLSDLHAPLVRWAPKEKAPDFTALAWLLESRNNTAPCRTTCYIASRRAASLFGGAAQGELKHDYQATHDLGLAAVYLHFRRHLPERESKWIGEDLLRPHYRRKKLPDAVLAVAPSAAPELVIEFGGAYDRRRLDAFHRDCANKQLAYEIW